MSEGWFVFAMGEFEARFPEDRRFAKNHMWAQPIGDDRWRLGLTAYAVRLLQDVYFLDWLADPGQDLRARATIGSIESKKAESDLFAPFDGVLRSINDATLDDPSLINAEPYGEGWLLELEASADVAEAGSLTPEDYRIYLAEAWKVAQRTIKGQVNQ